MGKPFYVWRGAEEHRGGHRRVNGENDVPVLQSAKDVFESSFVNVDISAHGVFDLELVFLLVEFTWGALVSLHSIHS